MSLRHRIDRLEGVIVATDPSEDDAAFQAFAAFLETTPRDERRPLFDFMLRGRDLTPESRAVVADLEARWQRFACARLARIIHRL
jgi:hypothetical protein